MPGWLNNLGVSYRNRFEQLGQVEDLEKAIKYQTQGLSLTPEMHASVSRWLNNLGNSYHSQYKHSKSPEALAQSVECFSRSALSLTGQPRYRFQAALTWAKLAPLRSTSETLLAFQTSINLIPHVVWLGKSLAQRYDDVHLIGDLATESAAAAISAGMHERALEWLEQARSIVWNQTLQLQTPFDELSLVNPTLGARLQQIATELHNAGAASQSSDELSPELASQKHRRLATQYDELINEVRSIDGFNDFMRPKKASQLSRAARDGPVVVVNVHKSRCDALILLSHQDGIGHVPLPDFSPDKA